MLSFLYLAYLILKSFAPDPWYCITFLLRLIKSLIVQVHPDLLVAELRFMLQECMESLSRIMCFPILLNPILEETFIFLK